MSASIEQMAYRPEYGTPWHGLGNFLSPGMTIDQEQAAAGLAWTVESSPMFYKGGDMPRVGGDFRVFFRSDRPDVVLGVNSKQFKPVQPRECLEFFHRLSEEADCTLDTAGVLQDGAKYWALARTGEGIEVTAQDGRTESFLLIATANNGTMATRIQPTAVRVVCQNTLSAAMSDRSQYLSINHRQNIDWESVRRWVRAEREEFALYGELMQHLAAVPVNPEQAADFAAQLIAPAWNRAEKAPRSLVSFCNTLSTGKGQREAGPTAYGLINAVTRYADHEVRAHSQATRLNSAWFGPGATLKQQALDLLLSQCVNKWGHRADLAPVLRETRFKALATA